MDSNKLKINGLKIIIISLWILGTGIVLGVLSAFPIFLGIGGILETFSFVTMVIAMIMVNILFLISFIVGLIMLIIGKIKSENK